MDEVKFYLSVFMRRLPWFLMVAILITATAVMVAVSLPPAYVSQMRLVVESPQIPEELAISTVRTPALEQLQIIEQRLLTRENLLDIARQLRVFDDITSMTPDEIVTAMRARTKIQMVSGRDRATLMTVSFEASDPRNAAGVLNEYLNLIQESDAEFRRGRAGETLAFFRQEVQRLGEEIDGQSAEILALKQSNSTALPESLNFRMSQRDDLQDQLLDIDRDISRFRNQRDRLVQIYEATGQARASGGGGGDAPQSPEEALLIQLESELTALLATFSEENPKVKLMRARIERLKAEIADKAAAAEAEAEAQQGAGEDGTTPPAGTTLRPGAQAALAIQLSEIDSEIAILEGQKVAIEEEIGVLDETIERTPEVAIALSEMERAQEILIRQYTAAEDRLAKAQTGELIESRSRGQRISVIEQPNIPDDPTKPNRVKIAGAGGALGIMAGLGLVMLLEFLNTSVRRPEDLVSRLGVTPFTTIPYIRTRSQQFRQRSLKALMLLAIVVGIPAAVYAVHIYYLPIDLVADKVMDKLGVRW